jgi:hypothetical protein
MNSFEQQIDSQYFRCKNAIKITRNSSKCFQSLIGNFSQRKVCLNELKVNFVVEIEYF